MGLPFRTLTARKSVVALDVQDGGSAHFVRQWLCSCHRKKSTLALSSLLPRSSKPAARMSYPLASQVVGTGEESVCSEHHKHQTRVSRGLDSVTYMISQGHFWSGAIFELPTTPSKTSMSGRQLLTQSTAAATRARAFTQAAGTSARNEGRWGKLS